MNIRSILFTLAAAAGIATAAAQPMKIPSGGSTSSQQQSARQKQHAPVPRYAVPVNIRPAVWYKGGGRTAFSTFRYPAKRQPSYTVFTVYRSGDTSAHGLWQLTDSLRQRASACSRRNAAWSPVVQTNLGGVPKPAGDSLTFILGRDSLHGSFSGELEECLFYPTALRQVERIVTESYLALKYGVTLHSDYLSPEGTLVWDSRADRRYTHGVAGIGRDTVFGLQRTACIPAEDSTLCIRLLPATGESKEGLLPGQYLLCGHSPAGMDFGTEVAIVSGGSGELLLELLERKWLVRATRTQGFRTRLSFRRDSLPEADTLYLLVDRSGKGDFDFSDCHGPFAVPRTGSLVLDLAWDADSSGTDVFTFARRALPGRSRALGGEEPEEAAFNGVPSAPRAAGGADAECYPNPVSDVLHVRASIPAAVTAVVTDGQGSVLYRKQYPGGNFDLDVRGFAAGSYVLHLRTAAVTRRYSFIVER